MTALQVSRSDLQIKANSAAHKTSEYMTKELAVRRGEPFHVQFHFNRPVKDEDQLQWWAKTGSSKNEHKISIPISSSSSGQPWSAVSEAIGDNAISVAIKSSADASIGRYTMGVKVKTGEGEVSQPCGDFILLFNAWCPGDAVYMKDEAQRNEYVLNETGRIYTGSARANPSYKLWDFGQFEERILDISLEIMDHSIEHRRNAAKDLSHRGDPIYVGRMLSAMINVQDDDGVLVGNWSGDYTGGETPTKWNGSVEILRRWSDSGPVRYGQCWVYGGVLCTVLRCLGIPARVITNFASAHDTDETLTVDRYFDEEGNDVFDSADSVWNFHVWNEAWFTRKDLQDSKYDGWQALDATPQEKSGGIYCLGPCSVNAVKNGDVDKLYDVAFVFCEINGDKVDWMYSDGEVRRLRVDTKSVGKFTSTKAVGSNKRLDVTNDYKYPEGSKTEREVYNKAVAKLQQASMRRAPKDSGPMAFSARNTEPVPKPDFEGAFKQSSDPEVGQEVTFILVLKNTGAEKSSLNVKMLATAIVYTNAPVTEIVSKTQSVDFEPKEEKSIPLTIAYPEYENAITTDNMIKAVAVCEDEKGGKLLVESVMTLRSPPILIKATAQAQIHKPFDVEIVFTNTLSEVIEGGVLTVEGSGLVNEEKRIELPILEKNQKNVTKLNITPYRSGERCLLVNLSSDKLYDVKGALPVKISPA